MSSNGAGPTPDHIMQVGLGFWASKALLSAVEMGVFTELSHGPREFTELVAQTRACIRAPRAISWMRLWHSDFCAEPRTTTAMRRTQNSFSTAISRATSAACSRWRSQTLRVLEPSD